MQSKEDKNQSDLAMAMYLADKLLTDEINKTGNQDLKTAFELYNIAKRAFMLSIMNSVTKIFEIEVNRK